MAKLYPDTCIFNDVMELIQNKVPEDRLLKPSEIKFKEKAFCMTHGAGNAIFRFARGHVWSWELHVFCFSRFTESNLVFFAVPLPKAGQTSCSA